MSELRRKRASADSVSVIGRGLAVTAYTAHFAFAFSAPTDFERTCGTQLGRLQEKKLFDYTISFDLDEPCWVDET